MKVNTDNEKIGLDLLRDCEYAVVTTIDENGLPYSIPISQVVVDDKIYFHTSNKGTLKKIVGNGNGVSIVAVGKTELVPEKFTTSYESAIATGKIEVIEDKDEKLAALKAICEKYALSNMDHFETAIENAFERTAIFKINVQKISSRVRNHRK